MRQLNITKQITPRDQESLKKFLNDISPIEFAFQNNHHSLVSWMIINTKSKKPIGNVNKELKLSYESYYYDINI